MPSTQQALNNYWSNKQEEVPGHFSLFKGKLSENTYLFSTTNFLLLDALQIEWLEIYTKAKSTR